MCRKLANAKQVVLLTLFSLGCHYQQPSITALPASNCNMHEPPGIPFYLPKPLLVISKNFHHIESSTVGLTNSVPVPTSFDDQSHYGTVDFDANYQRASSSGSSVAGKETPADGGSGEAAVAGASLPKLHSDGAPIAPGPAQLPRDGLGPHTFYTYEIVFVPDLTQKYVMSVQGGAGEIRATMNLVNGWMFTGLGPYYMKDSSTAQNIMSHGLATNLGLAGAADVVTSLAQLRGAAPGKSLDSRDVAELASALSAASEASKSERFDTETLGPGTIEKYAEVHVYEPYIDEMGQMTWRPIVGPLDPTSGLPMGHQFDRAYLGVIQKGNADPETGKNAAAAMERMLSPATSTSEAGSRDAPRDPFDVGMETESEDGDSTIINSILDRTLTVPPQPERHGILDHFKDHFKSQHVERTVDVVGQ